MVGEFMGSAVASQCAKSMLIDVSHTGQLPYFPLLTETNHGDSVVERAQGWLQKNMAREISGPELARSVGVSDRTLIRRFRAAIGRRRSAISSRFACKPRARCSRPAT